MRNLLVFSGSCGHLTFTEVDDREFELFATPCLAPTIGGPGPVVLWNRTRVGRYTRAVYVWPFRYTICQDCVNQDSEE